jgi:hypothetical protein
MKLFTLKPVEQPQLRIDDEHGEATTRQLAHRIRVIQSDERLGNLSGKSFTFDGVPSSLALAFVSPHSDFARTTSELQRLAGSTLLVAVSTADTMEAFVRDRSSMLKGVMHDVDTLKRIA